MALERISGRCPIDGSYMLGVGGFSLDAYQTEAFSYYCAKCKVGYTYIRPLSRETYPEEN